MLYAISYDYSFSEIYFHKRWFCAVLGKFSNELFVMVFIDTLHPTKFPLLKYFRKSSFLSWFEI